MIKSPTTVLVLALTLSLAGSLVISSELVYDREESREYVYYAVLSYCPKKCLESWSCQGGKDLPDFGEVSHVNNALTLAACYVGYDRAKDMIIVSFRGSANVQNWIEDFIFEKTSYNCKGCEIHTGFFADYLLIEAKLNEKVAGLLGKHPTALILTTGHSMGAAMAEIGGLRLKAKFGQTTIVHNFGSPRWGNAALAQYAGARVDAIFRVVHNRDIVPHLPPEPLEYHHSGHEVFWDEGMISYVLCSASGEDQNCSNKYAPKYSAADHDFYFLDLGSIKC